MHGAVYEQLVRAVLSEKLGLSPQQIQSTRNPGTHLPNPKNIRHDIQLFYVHGSDVTKQMTIVECIHLDDRPVDQERIQNLAFVRISLGAHKAIMVTNNGFTAGAKAVAESQQIALLVMNPKAPIRMPSSGRDSEALFAEIRAQISQNPKICDVVVVRSP